MSITADKIPEVCEQQNITKRATPPMNFDKAKGADEAPDTLLVKLPMGTGKTKALVDYLNSDQVPKDASVVIVSFCKSFTSKMHNYIGPEFVNYQNIAGDLNQDKVIVQIESLMRLKVCNLNKTILILTVARSS